MQYLRESSLLETRMEVRLALIDMINIRQRIATTRKICNGLSSMVAYYKKRPKKDRKHALIIIRL